MIAITAAVLLPPRLLPASRVLVLATMPNEDPSAYNGDSSASDFVEELKRRGFQTALQALEDEGPSAFKSPTKVIEYIMLNLQHNGAAGINEAFRFTCREPGKSSFVSGAALSAKRVSWYSGRVISGYVSGPALSNEEFRREVEARFDLLLGCAQWRFAVLHPQTFEPLARSTCDEFVREYVLIVDERPVSVRLLYDWGSWCYLVCNVRILEESPRDADAQWSEGESSTDPISEGGRKRGRGGSL